MHAHFHEGTPSQLLQTAIVQSDCTDRFNCCRICCISRLHRTIKFELKSRFAVGAQRGNKPVGSRKRPPLVFLHRAVSGWRYRIRCREAGDHVAPMHVFTSRHLIRRFALIVLLTALTLRFQVLNVCGGLINQLERVSAEVSLFSEQGFQHLGTWETAFAVHKILWRCGVVLSPSAQCCAFITLLNLSHRPKSPIDRSLHWRRLALCRHRKFHAKL